MCGARWWRGRGSCAAERRTRPQLASHNAKACMRTKHSLRNGPIFSSSAAQALFFLSAFTALHTTTETVVCGTSFQSTSRSMAVVVPSSSQTQAPKLAISTHSVSTRPERGCVNSPAASATTILLVLYIITMPMPAMCYTILRV